MTGFESGADLPTIRLRMGRQRKHRNKDQRRKKTSYSWLWIALPTAAVAVWGFSFDPPSLKSERPVAEPTSRSVGTSNSVAQSPFAMHPATDSFKPAFPANFAQLGDTEKAAYYQNVASDLV